MSDECTPYVPATPGDLITAENWNDMQCKAQEDIKTTAAKTKQEVKEEGVSQADNAGKFDGKSAKEWTDNLDERYAGKVHDHEGMANYRRFIKRFTPELDKVLLHHKLGRFPLVDVYRLETMGNIQEEKTRASFPAEFKDCKLFFYYGHADAEKYGLLRHVYREKIKIGVPFEQLLAELGVEYDDDDPIEDVLNDMWDAFMKEPNDELEHCESPWVRECCGQRRTVKELKKGNQWPDLYVAMVPLRVLAGDSPCPEMEMGQVAEPISKEELEKIKSEEARKRAEEENRRIEEILKLRQAGRGDILNLTRCTIRVVHVNFNTLFVEVAGVEDVAEPVDLMILLRS